jgi:hypothetical protein
LIYVLVASSKDDNMVAVVNVVPASRRDRRNGLNGAGADAVGARALLDINGAVVEAVAFTELHDKRDAARAELPSVIPCAAGTWSPLRILASQTCGAKSTETSSRATHLIEISAIQPLSFTSILIVRSHATAPLAQSVHVLSLFPPCGIREREIV